ncbi:YheV family putative zinc ribbon protein [Glaciecola sp. 2405UD65-10]|uniref:YheV family putative zinc ribbon protein n=1 Tax=Glaciecola sp. 2405UD65-10 TaxID=3397244 RepID=UPI003B5D046B
MSRTKKRFIAGAKCPSCGQLDTLMLYFENNIEKLACVKCDYKESQTTQEVAAASKSSSDVIGVFKP